MPNREPELYKDGIEVSLDGRQIFYLFFGGAAIVGLVFVLGVMVGRRIEARGHLEPAGGQTARDPLAALDRLESSDHLSFHGALTGSEAPTDVEKAIGEFEKRRAADTGDGRTKPKKHGDVSDEGRPETSDAKRSEARGDKPVTRPEISDIRDIGDARGTSDAASAREQKAKPGADAKPSARADAKPSARADAKPGARAATKPDARADARPGAKADDRSGVGGKARFTLQLSSFQDKAEADAFLGALKHAGYEPHLTEAKVSGRGTSYRVRLGSYRSLEAAQDAKAVYEKTVKKPAQIMQL